MAIQPFHEAVLPYNWAWYRASSSSAWWLQVAFRHRDTQKGQPLPDWIMFDREGYWVQRRSTFDREGYWVRRRSTVDRDDDRASGSPVGPFPTFNEAYATFVLLGLEG